MNFHFESIIIRVYLSFSFYLLCQFNSANYSRKENTFISLLIELYIYCCIIHPVQDSQRDQMRLEIGMRTNRTTFFQRPKNQQINTHSMQVYKSYNKKKTKWKNNFWIKISYLMIRKLWKWLFSLIFSLKKSR